MRLDRIQRQVGALLDLQSDILRLSHLRQQNRCVQGQTIHLLECANIANVDFLLSKDQSMGRAILLGSIEKSNPLNGENSPSAQKTQQEKNAKPTVN
jgi:hypothetical protein